MHVCEYVYNQWYDIVYVSHKLISLALFYGFIVANLWGSPNHGDKGMFLCLGVRVLFHK